MLAAALMLSAAAVAGAKAVKRTVVYASSIECKNCCRKVEENTGLEKGVIELTTDLDTQTITVLFDEAKTDTAKIAKSIRSLGFDAQVVSYK